VFRRLPLPPLLEERPWPVRIVLAGIIPMGFGFLCGAILDSSKSAYLGLQVLAALGGYFAGFEHELPHHARIRGVLGGLLFGGFVLIGHQVAGGTDHGLIPDPEPVMLVLTALLGAVLGMLGAYTRMRIELAGDDPPAAGP
jgi:hypothetical protein